MAKRKTINRNPADSLRATMEANAIPPWRTELARKFVVGDRLAHEEFARFMVLVFNANLYYTLRPWGRH